MNLVRNESGYRDLIALDRVKTVFHDSWIALCPLYTLYVLIFYVLL